LYVEEFDMQKIQVFLRTDQKSALKSLARRLGLRQADLVRRGVDLVIDKAGQEQDDWRAATRAAAGLWRGRSDIDTITQDLRERAKARLTQARERE
jgi:hypothetical protein